MPGENVALCSAFTTSNDKDLRSGAMDLRAWGAIKAATWAGRSFWVPHGFSATQFPMHKVLIHYLLPTRGWYGATFLSEIVLLSRSLFEVLDKFYVSYLCAP